MPASNAPGTDAPRPLRVAIVLLHQFTMMAFAGFLDVLRLAGDYGGHSRQILIQWQVMSSDGEPRRSSAGTLLTELVGLNQNPESFDYIAVCGGNSYAARQPSDRLTSWLRQAYEHGTTLLGLCTGTFALAQAGLADGHTVCIHWNVTDEFQRQFPHIRYSEDNLFIDSGRLITCAGSTATIDLALYMLTRHFGKEKAQQAMRHMMVQSIRPARLPQAHFYVSLEHVADPRIHKAVHYLEHRIDDLPSLEDIAAYVGVGKRQLARLFRKELGTTPAAMYRMMRLQYGKWQLTNTRKSITDIALSCGFSDNAHFTRSFKDYFGMLPSTLRREQS